MDYAGKVVVVTGASSGIGYTTARAFARKGAKTVGVARRTELLDRLVDECSGYSGETSYLSGDLGRRDFAENVIRETVARHGTPIPLTP